MSNGVDYRERRPGETREAWKNRTFMERYAGAVPAKTAMTTRELLRIAAKQQTPATFKGATGRMVVKNPPYGKVGR